jgi:hypothetical protein
LHILEEQTQKKICCPKIISKLPLNSRWLPKLYLLVKTKSSFFKNRIQGCFSCLNFIEKKNSQKFNMDILGTLIFVRNFKMVKCLHIFKEKTTKKTNKKNCCPKINSKWPLSIKMATKTKFACKCSFKILEKRSF